MAPRQYQLTFVAFVAHIGSVNLAAASNSAPPAPSPNFLSKTGDCDSNCHLDADNLHCRSRVYQLHDQEGYSYSSAVGEVNQECLEQCSCSISDFPTDLSLLPSPPLASDTPNDEPQPVAVKIINNCDEDIDLRTPHLDHDEDDSAGPANYETIAAGAEKNYAPGFVKAMKVVLAWKDASNMKCHNGVFCTQIELTISNQMVGMRTSDHPNFVNQLAFTDMPIGAAFFKDGAAHPECPQPMVSKCKQDPSWCTTSQGKFDKCLHNMEKCTSDVGLQVQLNASSSHFYCLSPDVNKAVVSEDMKNPSKAQCALQMDPSRWLCRGNCKNLTNSPTGTTDTLCGSRYDMAWLVQNQNLKLFKNGLLMTPSDFIENPLGGAKPYQTAVNQACGNQPPSQRAKTTETGGSPSTSIAADWVQEYDRSYARQGHLDHAITYESDDANMWEIVGQKYPHRGLFMAGSTGMQCDSPKKWDTFVIKACPTASD